MTAALEQAVRARLRERGRITFAEFMAAALYDPAGGYYTAGEPIGAAGDFYTAPAAHPAFGALIARQMEEMWRLLDSPRVFHIVEPGAGNGRLARDVLAHAEHLSPDFRRALRYIAVERRPPATPRKAGDGPSTEGRWVLGEGLPVRNVEGCILTNELVDAFPVHGVVWAEGRLREVYVALDAEGRFAEELGELSTPALAERFARLGITLQEGQRAEVCLGLEAWSRSVASALTRGFVLTVDYGDVAERLYGAERLQGTLACSYRHAPAGSPYQRMGEQDITAHVDFSALAAAGEAHGLRALGLTSQRAFLLNLGMQGVMEAAKRQDTPQRERDANMLALRDLLRPDGLGGFR
ncbi:MAG: SAM-dependent methyltransferase, partial [Chloroflexota bacterium]